MSLGCFNGMYLGVGKCRCYVTGLFQWFDFEAADTNDRHPVQGCNAAEAGKDEWGEKRVQNMYGGEGSPIIPA